MRRLIVYYSYTGNTAKMAEKLAEKRRCDVLQVKDAHRPGTLKAYTLGILAALRGKAWEIEPAQLNFEEYDFITVMAPVWAGKPAPQINGVLQALPSGKQVEVIMVSGSGESNCKQKLEKLLELKDCRMADFKNVRGKLAEQLDSNNNDE